MTVLTLLLYAVSLLTLISGNETRDFQCVHERNPKMVVGVKIGKETHLEKRQSVQLESFRISIFYDSSVDGLTENQRNRLQNTVMPAVESFLEGALTVIPETAPILLERDCVGGSFVVPIGDVRECFQQCESTTTCIVTIPEDHLKRCVQCNGDLNSECETVGVDGNGVNNTDFILYVGTISCSNAGTLAFATNCQLESSLDRPIAGAVNFCPGRIDDQSDRELIDTGIHEVLHALVFSSNLYPFYRDENGDPRTPRDQNGFPPQDNSGFFTASDNTIRTEVYTDWQTRSGTTNHEVQLLVTPNVVEQAMAHYNCPTLRGVEVENQGGPGTATSHWEQRLLGNEGMTGFALFNAPFSRITFGLLQDSGWYIPNYSMAQDLAWGKNTGCRFAHGSCGEWIDTQMLSGTTLAPFCNRLSESPSRLGCTADRSVVSSCNLIDYGNSPPPSEFQYFNSGPNFDSSVAPRVGGALFVTDFCPFQREISLSNSLRECINTAAQPTNNILAESYGFGSRCVEHGRQWSRTIGGTTTTAGLWGGGCYQFSCSASTGVEIQVLGLRFRCSCEGEELVLDITVSGTRYEGSLICPSCAQICFDAAGNCSAPEPNPCYDRETQAVPITDDQFTCYEDFSNTGTCLTEIGQTTSVGGCCDGLGGNAFIQDTGPCVQCPQSVTIGLEMTSYSFSEEDGMAIICAAISSAGTGAQDRNVSVTISAIMTTGDTAEVGSDFDASPITHFLDASSNPQGCLTVTLTNNNAVENMETFTIQLSSTDSGVTLSPSSATVTINDIDLLFGLEMTSYTVSEGSQSTLSVCVLVLEGQLARSVPLLFLTSSGSATDGDDFIGGSFARSLDTSSSGMVCIDISIINDTVVEAVESFTISVSTTDTAVTISPSSATVVIADNDGVTVGFEMTTYLVGEDDVVGQGETVEVCAVITDGQLQGTSVTLTFVTGITGTAASNEDYDSLADTRILDSADAGRECVILSILPDSSVEGNETFPILLDSTDPIVTVSPSSATILIIDNDVQIGWQVLNYQAVEGMATTTACATVIAGSGNIGARTIDVQVSCIGITAQGGGVDFGSPNPSTFIFTTSQIMQCTNISIIDDLLVEGSTDETFNIMLTQTAVPTDPNIQLSPATAVVAIDDNDVGIMRFSQSAYSVDENGATVSVNLVLDSDSGTLVSDIVVEVIADTQAGDTATDGADEDFIGTTCLTTFTSASSGGTFSIPTCLFTINDDNLVELAENFSLSATIISSSAQPSQFSSGGDSASVAINNDDGLNFQFRDTPIVGPESTSNLEVVVILATGSGTLTAAAAPVIIQVQTVLGGTATVGASGDYLELASGPLSFNTGDSSQSTSIVTNEDNLIEGTENILLSATIKSDPSGRSQFTPGGITATNIANILDNDAAVFQFTEMPYNVNESVAVLQVGIELAPGSGTVTTAVAPISIQLQTLVAGSTASEGIGQDYIAINTALQFIAGSSSMTESITINNDNMAELTETISLSAMISDDPSGTALFANGFPNASNTANIIDDDVGMFRFNQSTYNVNENAGTLVIVMELTPSSGILTTSVVISVQNVTGGTASEGVDGDYLGLSTVLTFTSSSGPGDSMSVSIAIIDDNLDESTETILLEASILSGQQFAQFTPGGNTATASINDDEDPVVQAGFESTAFNVAEGQSLVQVCAVILNQVEIGTRTFVVTIMVSGGSAQGGGVDYGTLPTSNVIFTAANLRMCINISITDDSLVEGLESFSLSLSESNPDFDLTVPTTTVEITDNDFGIFRFNQSTYNVNENAGPLEVVMEMAPNSGILTTNATLQVQTVTGGTATEGVDGDYLGLSTVLTFTSSSGPGDSMSVSIAIIDDNLDESTETILLEASILSGQQFAQFTPGGNTATISINDNEDPVVQAGFESTAFTVAEGQSLVQVCAVILNQVEIGTRTFVVTIMVSGGSAQGGGVDYGTLPTNNVIFTAANLRMCINISITDDSLVEGLESFSLSLSESNPDFDLTVPTTTVEITDNDFGIFRFNQSSYNVNENAGPLGAVMEMAPNSGILTTNVTLQVQTVTGGTATEGVDGDYLGLSTVLTFTSSSGPGDSMSVSIAIIDDNLDESTETILLEASILSGQQFAQFTPGGNTATVSINDDEDPVVQAGFESTAFNVAEGQSLVQVCAVILNQVEIGTRTFVVTIMVSGGSAQGGGVDYGTLPTNNVIFTAANLRMCINISITDDSLVEGLESFSLSLSESNLDFDLTVPTTTVEITDNDFGIFRFNQSSYNVNENAGPLGAVMEMAPNSGILTTNVTLQVQTVTGGTATEGVDGDYLGISTVLTFTSSSGPGDSMSVSIAIIDDNLDESTETILLEASILSGQQFAQFTPGGNTATVSINDDEDPVVQAGFESTAFTVAEGQSLVQVCAVILNQVEIGTRTFVVTIMVSGGSAQGGGVDYGTLPTNNVIFTAANLRMCINISITDDSLVEGLESFSLTLSESNPDFDLTAPTTTVEITDNDFGIFRFNQSTYNVNENAGPLEVVMEMAPNSGILTTNATLQVQTVTGGTATEGVDGDYLGLSTVLTFTSSSGPGDSMSVSIAIIDDNLDESTETILLEASILSGQQFAQFSPGGNTATVSISDNEVDVMPVEVGLEQDSYTAREDIGDNDLALLVCANTSTDVQFGFAVTVSLQSGTALAGLDFPLSVKTLNFLPGMGNQRRCACVEILQDSEDEDDEMFSALLSTTSPNIIIIRNASTVTIVDDDDPEINLTLRWINASPRVEGNTVMANLAIGESFQSVMCQVTTLPVQDCSSGSVIFTGLRPNRRNPFNFTVEGTGPAGERAVIYRTFRIDTILDCWLHLINDGLTIMGDTVTVQWQATGPSADNRATTFRCILDGRTRDCQPSEGFTVSGLSVGNHELTIRPTDPDCTRRRIRRRFQFQIL